MDAGNYSDDAARFRQALNTQISFFVEEELGTYYSQLIAFVKEVDSSLLKNPNAPIDKGNIRPPILPTQTVRCASRMSLIFFLHRRCRAACETICFQLEGSPLTHQL
jgi:hypothetical protein